MLVGKQMEQKDYRQEVGTIGVDPQAIATRKQNCPKLRERA